MANVYGILTEPSAEDALHAERLLHIEERPLQRVTRRLLGDDSLFRSVPRQLPSPPPEGDDPPSEAAEPADADPFKRQKFREDILIDFAALESSITRIQLIQSSNARERERYAAEKAKILSTAQSVRANTLQLREQLVEAQKVLQLRKEYDELAAKILDDRKLKSREEASSEIQALEKEIEELEAEGQEIEGLWEGRREAFEKVVAEGEVMMRVIKGIKEQPDEEDKAEDEVMEEGEDGPKATSRLGTPGVEGGRTPRFDAGDATPMHEGNDLAKATQDDGEYLARNKHLAVGDATRLSSAAVSPLRQEAELTEDVDMVNDSKAGDDVLAEQPKTSFGMEATDDQVMESGEKMDET